MARLPWESDITERIREFKQREREFEEAMAEARAAKKRKRKRKLKPKSQRPRGAPGNPLKQEIIDDARRRIAAGKTAKLAADLYAKYLKKGGPVEKTIRRWLADDDGT